VLWHVRRARTLPFLAAVALGTATFPLRTLRWAQLLRLDGAELPLIPLWHATAIGFMANNLLPARAGEMARAYAAGRLTGVRWSAAVGSVAVERLLDGLVLVALLLLGMAWGGLARATTVGGVALTRVAMLATLVFLPALVAAFWMVHWPGPEFRAARWTFKRVLPAQWAGRMLGMLEGVLAGLDALKSPRRLALVTVWSLVLWLVSASSLWMGFVALGLDVPASGALVLQGLIAFGVAIPSSPGFFGPFEAVTRACLSRYGVTPAAAVSYAVAYHVAVFLPISALGLWSLARAHLHLAELKSAGQ
jgi:uncharacterized protein (TIRG00374 family)